MTFILVIIKVSCCVCDSILSPPPKDESSQGEVDDFYRGELRVSLSFKPPGEGERGKKEKGSLEVLIKQAKELPRMDAKGTNGVVKLYLLPNRSSTGKRKTGVIKNNLSPVWEERFTFEGVSTSELSSERVLEVTVWDHGKSGNDFIGGLRLGPPPGRAAKHKEWMDAIGDEVSHWEDMLSRPGEWVEEWHSLRATMDPRNVDLSSYQAYQQQELNTAAAAAVAITAAPLPLEEEFKKTSPKVARQKSPSPPKPAEASFPTPAPVPRDARQQTPPTTGVGGAKSRETTPPAPVLLVEGSSRESSASPTRKVSRCIYIHVHVSHVTCCN